MALVIGDSMTFAHIVYSKLNSNDNAVVGYASYSFVEKLMAAEISAKVSVVKIMAVLDGNIGGVSFSSF